MGSGAWRDRASSAQVARWYIFIFHWVNTTHRQLESRSRPSFAMAQFRFRRRQGRVHVLLNSVIKELTTLTVYYRWLEVWRRFYFSDLLEKAEWACVWLNLWRSSWKRPATLSSYAVAYSIFYRLFSERELKFRFAICRRPTVCRLSSVCNVRAPYSDDWHFRQCFYAIGYLGHLLTSR